MKIITDEEIRNLNISPNECVGWIRKAFLMKNRCQLPPKISLHPRNDDFVNTMPCLLPPEYNTFGCKVVSRINGMHPALKSHMMMIDTTTGELKALIDADWITAWRTGAVATFAVIQLQKRNAQIYSLMGLGTIGHTTLECLLAMLRKPGMIVRLLRYKDHAEKVIEEFAVRFPEVEFQIANTTEELVENADVVLSAITVANDLIVENTNLFKPGVLVVPIHTRGFQNCDTVFEKVFADDEGHVRGFKYFNQFRKFGELADVLKGKVAGRELDTERILSYNIGLGLHDVYFVNKIEALLNCK